MITAKSALQLLNVVPQRAPSGLDELGSARQPSAFHVGHEACDYGVESAEDGHDCVGAVAGAYSGQRGGNDDLEGQTAVDEGREDDIFPVCCLLFADDVSV